MRLIGFQQRATKRELKPALKRTEVFCLYSTGTQAIACSRLLAAIHCIKWRSLRTLMWYSRETEGGTRSLITDWPSKRSSA